MTNESSPPMDIHTPSPTRSSPARRVSHSLLPTPSFGTSPGLAHNLYGGSKLAKALRPFDSGEVKILLLENVNASGREILKKEGYQVEALKSSLAEEELIEKIRCVAMD